jgi:hypothetical protein
MAAWTKERAHSWDQNLLNLPRFYQWRRFDAKNGAKKGQKVAHT